MGIFDDMFPRKKEGVKSRTGAASPKKDTAKQRTQQQISNDINPSRPTFFGSFRRGSASSLVTSTPKSTPTATKTSGTGKTSEHISLRNKPPDREKKPWLRSTNSNILRTEPTKSSNTPLNANVKSTNVIELKKRRPLTAVALAPNVTVRRGQKIDGQNLPDNLSRTSSITNIDAEQKLGKGAKPRKTASRDRIDKVGENRKNDKKGVSKNNNKLDTGESPFPSIDSLQEEEFLQLRRQLQEMAQEKSNLALQLGEQKGQLNSLQKEIQSLKEESNLQLEQLTEENTALRNRLRDVAHSPLSDNEKQQLLYETQHRHHSSAPASIATNLIDEGNGGDITACPTPDWDKHSSSNVSEVSVACLQDKINQMQETHYSTNEELQATLQELTDLQRQLTELQQENERLNEEKTLMFDSLCRQTERLNDTRSEVESLKQLLYREKDETGQYESALEREQKLVELLKTTQEEKQALMLKLEQINIELQEARAALLEKDERIAQLSERVRTLESTLDAKHAEHKLIDQELAQAKDQCNGKQIEINRLTDLLDNARTKIIELEQDRALSDKSELDELLDNARKEKDSLESEVAHLKEQLAISKNEIEKLKEQVSILQEECKVTRNNARTTQCDLEYKCEKLLLEKNNLNDQLLEFQEAVNELQVQSQCQAEEKRQLSAVLSETQRNLSESERKNLTLETELQELKKVRTEEVEEWEKFQNDLLTSVRVANDFKTEAQQELQRMILENKSFREKERHLKAELEKLKGDKENRKVKPKVTQRRNSADMENLLGLSRRSKERQRKSRDIDAPHESVEKKPEVAPKPVKKREKPTRSKKNVTLSVEEELLLRSLNDWYENIDKNIPEDKLTEEQRVVKKLKAMYEHDGLKEKPVAHKPKNQLAISKPLLDSVFLNPKLEEIAKDPTMPTIEELGSFEVLSCAEPELRILPDISNRQAARSVDYTDFVEPKRISIIGRSKSYDDLRNYEENYNSSVLYRSNETEDVRKDAPLVKVERESSILPSDSVSNPRYSDFAYVISSNKDGDVAKAPKLARNSSVNFETLNHIVASIPKNSSDDQLTSEQKFALKLKQSLDEAERKSTLKKIRKIKCVIISTPTADSVQKNSKLKNILLDPRIQSVRRNSEADKAGMYFNDPVKESKSCEDISFSFKAQPKDNVSVDSAESVLGNSYGFNRKISLNETFSNPGFHVEESLSSPYDEGNLKSFKEFRIDDVAVPNKDRGNNLSDEDLDLLYNETLQKKMQKEMKAGLQSTSKQFVAQSFEERVNKNQAVAVSSTVEYATILHSASQDQHPIGDNGMFCSDDSISNEAPIFRVKSVKEGLQWLHGDTTQSGHESIFSVKSDDDGILTHSTTVTTPEEYVAVFDTVEDFKSNYDGVEVSADLTDNAPCLFTAKSDEDEVHKDFSVIISPPEEFVAVLEQSSKTESMVSEPSESTNFEGVVVADAQEQPVLFKSDHAADNQFSGLTYNETLSKKLKNSSEPVAEPVVPDIIVGLNSYNDPTAFCDPEDDTNELLERYIREGLLDDEAEEEYDYHAILKENRYGVISPLNIRLSYKDVVKEIKSKIPKSDDSASQTDSYFDEYLNSTEVTPTAIDVEMEDILKKFLNAPVSKIITQIDVTDDADEDRVASATNFAILPTGSDVTTDEIETDVLNADLTKAYGEEQSTEKIECENHTPQLTENVSTYLSITVNEKPLPDDTDSKLSEEEISLLRSVKNTRFSRPLSDFNENDLRIIERLSEIYLPRSNVSGDANNEFGSRNDSVDKAEGVDERDKAKSDEKINSDSIVEERLEEVTDEARNEDSERKQFDIYEVAEEVVTFEIPKTSMVVVNMQPVISDVIETSEVGSVHTQQSNDKLGSKRNDETTDIDTALARMTSPSNMSRKKVLDINVKPKVILRNTNYESVRSKLEYFSKQADLSTDKRQSFNPHTNIVPSDRRKVKSWAEHFERRSLDTNSSYEPVYANLNMLGLQKSNSVVSSKIEKKPLPVPRSKNLASTQNIDSDSTDKSVEEAKMSDCKILSENDTENLNQEITGSDFNSIGKIKVPSIPLFYGTSKVIIEGSPKEIENEEMGKTGTLGVNRSEKFLEMHDGENAKNKEEESENLASGAESSFSSIAVAGKFEQLDITKPLDGIEEITNSSESHLNLFHLESPSLDESYLSLFKSPEEKMYDDIRGLKKPVKGYLNFTYLDEVSDNESSEEADKVLIERQKYVTGTDSTPKIIDFVPLDDGTKPMFRKEIEPSYDTLEREKTFHVLNLAASTGAVKKTPSRTEYESIKTVTPTNSRMSFSAAKKVFENLLEANLDKTNQEKPKLTSKESIRKIETTPSNTVVKKQI